MILLDVEAEDEDPDLDAVIWHNCTAGREWTALNFSEHSNPHKLVCVQGIDVSWCFDKTEPLTVDQGSFSASTHFRHLS